MLSVGDNAPPFEALDQDQHSHRLKEYAGKWVLLYFYPKDDTPGCTTEACTFRDNYQELQQKILIFGVSRDGIVSHKKFADKYQIPFPLLADPNRQIIDAYKAWGSKKFMGREFAGALRVSYLINPEGKIAKVYPDVKPAEHAKEILEDIEKLAQ